MMTKESLQVLEAILRNHGTAEVKLEKGKVVVVEISRKVKYRPDSD